MEQQPTFEDFLAEIRDAELRATPRRHPDWTQLCPPLTAFPEAAASGRWKDPAHQGHTPTCPYCRKMLTMQWELAPPSLLTLAKYAAKQLPDHVALEMFLDSGSDEAEKSNLLRRSKRVAFLKENLHLAETLKSTFQDQLALFAPLSFVWQQKGEAEPPIHVRDQGERLRATLYEEHGMLCARVRLSDEESQPTTVRLELIRTGTDDSIVVEQDLSPGGVEDVELISLSKLHDRPAGHDAAHGGCVLLTEVLPRN